MSRHQSHIDKFTVKQEETTEISVSEDVSEFMAKCCRVFPFPKGYCHLSAISDSFLAVFALYWDLKNWNSAQIK